MLRKIDRMHELFGTNPYAKCRDCDHLIVGTWHDKKYKKCEVYGMSHSEATDWAFGWWACGMFNQEYNGKPVYKIIERDKKEEIQCEGQLELGWLE